MTGYTDTVQRWIGHDANVLVRTWGEPQSTFPMPNGNTVYVYATSTNVQTDKRLTCSYDAQAHADRCTLSGGEVLQFGCKTRFEVGPDQRVTFAEAEGTACLVAPEPPASARVAGAATVPAAPAPQPAAAPIPAAAPVPAADAPAAAAPPAVAEDEPADAAGDDAADPAGTTSDATGPDGKRARRAARRKHKNR